MLDAGFLGIGNDLPAAALGEAATNDIDQVRLLVRRQMFDGV